MTHACARKRRGDARGFTLMELLVVMTIFTTTVLIASDVFVISARTQRKVYGWERTQADARYTVEAIAREVRTGAIDYDWYAANGGLSLPTDELALRQSDGTEVRFAVSDDATKSLCVDAQSTPCMLVAVGGGTPAAVTPKNVAVRSARFYVAPTADPHVLDYGTGAYASDVQPRVTVVLVLESKGGAAEEQTLVHLQTTATSRSYVR